MHKSESIFKLQDLGLNTLDYFITDDIDEAVKYLNEHPEELLSMRTERNDEFNCPFHYMLKGRSLILMANEYIDRGYKLILAPSLDTKGCLAFGTVALGTGDNVMEFVFGEGKIRDLYYDSRKQHLFIPREAIIAARDQEFPDKAYILNTIYVRVKERCYDEIPCVVEWSFYNRPVGKLGTQDIWWEIRPYV